MSKFYYAVFIMIICSGLSFAQTYDLQFIEETNDMTVGGNFDVRIQIRSVGGTFGMGTSNLVFDFDTTGLSCDSTITPHNFSLGLQPELYNIMTITKPAGYRVSLNIQLLLAPGQTVTAGWMDVATINFTITDPAQSSNFVWNITAPNRTNVFDDQALPVEIPANTLNPGDFSLPVELTSFTANVTSDLAVSLEWVTESEINNLGFEVFRSTEEEGNYTLLSNYQSNPDLKGHGNSSTKNTYNYIDDSAMPNNTYWYKLSDVDINGVVTYHEPTAILVESGVIGGENPDFIPDEFQLGQNYPNPFNPETRIRVGIPDVQDIGEISIDVYDIMGKRVITLYKGNLDPGIHTFKWDGSDRQGKQVSGGTYFYYLKSNKFHQIKKMVFMK